MRPDPELIRANLRFAFSVAKQYQNRGVPLGDLVSEANAGLVRAADKYDPDVGVNFISYAVWWIRQALHSAVQRQSRTVQVPLNRAADLSRVSRAQELLRQRLSREPYEEEIASVADLSLDVTRGLVALLQPTRSLDEPAISGEPGRTLGETLVLDRGEDEDVLPGGIESDSRREAIARALDVLPPRDRRVLILYFGLEGNRPMTLQEIARELGVTRERVRQLRDRALKRLRESDTAGVSEGRHGGVDDGLLVTVLVSKGRAPRGNESLVALWSFGWSISPHERKRTSLPAANPPGRRAPRDRDRARLAQLGDDLAGHRVCSRRRRARAADLRLTVVVDAVDLDGARDRFAGMARDLGRVETRLLWRTRHDSRRPRPPSAVRSRRAEPR